MSPNFEDELIGYYIKIASALIEASPGHLNDVSVELDVRENSVTVIVPVTDNSKDYFSPTDDLLIAVGALYDFLKSNNKVFTGADFKVSLNSEGRWGYSVELRCST